MQALIMSPQGYLDRKRRMEQAVEGVLFKVYDAMIRHADNMDESFTIDLSGHWHDAILHAQKILGDAGWSTLYDFNAHAVAFFPGPHYFVTFDFVCFAIPE